MSISRKYGSALFNKKSNRYGMDEPAFIYDCSYTSYSSTIDRNYAMSHSSPCCNDNMKFADLVGLDIPDEK